MKEDKKFSMARRLKSFQYAFEGIISFFRTEQNAWLHLVATICVVTLAIIADVSNMEAIALVVAIALVWITEMLNTGIEKAMDLITQEIDPKIKFIKDVSAGAVLVASIAALLIGLFVFATKFIDI